jgi:hypothetical protein
MSGVAGGRNFVEIVVNPDLFGSFDADVWRYVCKEVWCSMIENRCKGRCFFAENV